MDNCPHTQDNLDRYLERAFTDQAEQALRAHLAQCPACAAAFERMDLLQEVIRDAVMPESDVQRAAARITERLAQERVKPPQDFVRHPLGLDRVRLYASAAALLLIGMGLGFAGRSYWQRPATASLSPVPIQVAQVKGKVLVKHQNTSAWQVLTSDSPAYLGDTFYTTATSDLVLSLDQTNQIKLAENSMLTLESYDPSTEFYLEHGQCTPVLNGPHGPFFIRTPNSRLEALGTEFTVRVTE